MAIVPDPVLVTPGIPATSGGHAIDTVQLNNGTVNVDRQAMVLGDGQTYANLLAIDASGRITVLPAVAATAAVLYRSAVTAADVLPTPVVGTPTAVSGGSLVNTSVYNIKVVAGTLYGRTTGQSAAATVTASGANLTARIPITASVGADTNTFYDIYLSTDADPKWVGRVTEAQRASGIIINGVGSVTAGGTVNNVDVQVAGTGLQALTSAAVNFAYVIPAATAITCTGFDYVDFDIAWTRTGDGVLPALTVVPFFIDSQDSVFYSGTPVPVTLGGAAGLYNAHRQTLRFEVRGRSAAHLLVASIAGTGASINIRAVTS